MEAYAGGISEKRFSKSFAFERLPALAPAASEFQFNIDNTKMAYLRDLKQ